MISSLLTLFVFSNEFLFLEICRLYEYPVVQEKELEESYSAAIILGGMVRFNEYNEQVEFQGSSDRFLNVLPLYFDGRVKKLLLSGGSGRLLQDEKESTILKDYLLKIGVKEADLLIESESRNTYENALYSSKLLNARKLQPPYLLTTSASHMGRSMACFEKQALDVDPFPVDYHWRSREYNPDRLFMPKASVLSKWNWLIHEWVGLLTYKLMGYI